MIFGVGLQNRDRIFLNTMGTVGFGHRAGSMNRHYNESGKAQVQTFPRSTKHSADCF